MPLKMKRGASFPYQEGEYSNKQNRGKIQRPRGRELQNSIEKKSEQKLEV